MKTKFGGENAVKFPLKARNTQEHSAVRRGRCARDRLCTAPNRALFAGLPTTAVKVFERVKALQIQHSPPRQPGFSPLAPSAGSVYPTCRAHWGGQLAQFAALAGRRARTRADAVGYIATYKTFTAVGRRPSPNNVRTRADAVG